MSCVKIRQFHRRHDIFGLTQLSVAFNKCLQNSIEILELFSKCTYQFQVLFATESENCLAVGQIRAFTCLFFAELI